MSEYSDSIFRGRYIKYQEKLPTRLSKSAKKARDIKRRMGALEDREIEKALEKGSYE